MSTLEVGDSFAAIMLACIHRFEIEAEFHRLLWKSGRSSRAVATLVEGILEQVAKTRCLKLVVGEALQTKILVSLPDLVIKVQRVCHMFDEPFVRSKVVNVERLYLSGSSFRNDKPLDVELVLERGGHLVKQCFVFVRTPRVAQQ